MADAPRYCSTCLKRFNERSSARVYKSVEWFFLAYFYLSLLQYISIQRVWKRDILFE